MVVSREALDALPVQLLATPEALWEPARAAGRLGGVVVRGRWREVGTPAGYLEAALDRVGGRSAVDPAAAVDPRATLRSSYLGEGARVAADAVIDESVVACGATVGRGARVTRSVLLGPVGIGDGEIVDREYRAAPYPTWI
jgi:NDP-sugar pyrophosphorylase family protein